MEEDADAGTTIMITNSRVCPLHSFMLYRLWGKTPGGLINTGCY
jgi:hypothetical protein